ncbi:unnamed protein product [Arctia plantaginis]|uniref:Uncharacterized protein n=1 Tax=Arctia plantaginis TaxID=874455 RepID=A0A8S0Z0K2_ARCPL|nr:unnamed protein product [Arctia plantaginis]
MGDVYKIPKDKRHRSSSSLAGVVLDGTRSERKLDLNVASIQEVDDQFTGAEARCDELQEKINLIQSLKRKKKIKKRSMTKVMDQPQTSDKFPCISVRTYPKKKVSQQASRMHRFEVPPNPTRGYLDPATIEQHRMIGQVRGYNKAFNRPLQERSKNEISSEQNKHNTKIRAARQHRSQAEGDSMYGQDIKISNGPAEAACGPDDDYSYYSHSNEDFDPPPEIKSESCRKTKTLAGRRRHIPRDLPLKEAANWLEERPVVELFNKRHGSPHQDHQNVQPQPEEPQRIESQRVSSPRKPKKTEKGRFNNEDLTQLDTITHLEEKQQPRKETHQKRVKYKSRRYELPTVASQMKQASIRYYYDTTNHTNIPFVVSKSTAPSHNIGVNIQQVLNCLKMQQPLSGIPLTIAHHMGLSHVPTSNSKSVAVVQPDIEHQAINTIRVGQRMLRLPSYKYVSYKRLLSMYREGEGMVPRFLRAISRPHYFYTSMYNLATHHEDFDGATSKGNAACQEAKQNIAEFANLYREYENLNRCTKDGKYEPELELRKEELSKDLAAREQQLRKLLQDNRSPLDLDQNLRASASMAEDNHRQSKYKLLGDSLQ